MQAQNAVMPMTKEQLPQKLPESQYGTATFRKIMQHMIQHTKLVMLAVKQTRKTAKSIRAVPNRSAIGATLPQQKQVCF